MIHASGRAAPSFGPEPLEAPSSCGRLDLLASVLCALHYSVATWDGNGGGRSFCDFRGLRL
ncbi:hypothetical protein E2562_039446 [Oryza meyeriana var. granulata]|uniref:Uncharacterized protein n=1 Tax=Oryza meyeriana var. granulata TaxID=110450 RepID=A0A6G1ECW6_9ORYZ|nr:hypothetical protein E2562_039446 [Oryza meyeriana var. granulata]